jgi:hypothetical protein
VITSLLAVVYLVTSFLAAHGEPGVIIPIGLAVGVVGLLWLPNRSRDYFRQLERPSVPIFLIVESALDNVAERIYAGVSSSSAPKDE